ncbi:hypothetical protein FRB94_005469 [Tulasnella sp. JGI-2019a]|nr:hypothetical protein FRB94_005469 [Tulasnella sp. JGI-2019a]
MNLNYVRHAASGPRSFNSGYSSNSPLSPTSSIHDTSPIGPQPVYPLQSSLDLTTRSIVGPLTSSSTVPYRCAAFEGDIYRGLTLTDLVDQEPGKDPGYSKSALIQAAIQGSVNQRLRQSEIRDAIMERFPYFRTAGKTWQNSLRHALTNNKCFYKVSRPSREPGRGSYWAYKYIRKSKVATRFNPVRQVRVDRPASLPNGETESSTYKLPEQDFIWPNVPAQPMTSQAGHSSPLSISLSSSEQPPVYFPTDFPLFFEDAAGISDSPYSAVDPCFLVPNPTGSPTSVEYAPRFGDNAVMKGTAFVGHEMTMAPDSSSNFATAPLIASLSQHGLPPPQQHFTPEGQPGTSPFHAINSQQEQRNLVTPLFTPLIYPDTRGSPRPGLQPQHGSQYSLALYPSQSQSEPFPWASVASNESNLLPHNHQYHQHITQPRQLFEISSPVAVSHALGDAEYKQLQEWLSSSSSTTSKGPKLNTNARISSVVTPYAQLPQLHIPSHKQASLAPPSVPSPSYYSSDGASPSLSLGSGSPLIGWDAGSAEQELNTFSFDWNVEQS